MEQAQTPTSFKFPESQSTDQTMGISNHTIIVGLLIILALSFLGINIFTAIGNLFDSIISLVGPLFAQILSVFGYTAGSVINTGADVATDVTKTGIDIAGGTLQSIGNLLKDASRGNVDRNLSSGLDNILNTSNSGSSSRTTYVGPVPSASANPVQRPITSNKSGWCLVGEYEGKRGCIAVDEQDRCMSGQIYPSQVACMNPSNYVSKQ